MSASYEFMLSKYLLSHEKHTRSGSMAGVRRGGATQGLKRTQSGHMVETQDKGMSFVPEDTEGALQTMDAPSPIVMAAAATGGGWDLGDAGFTAGAASAAAAGGSRGLVFAEREGSAAAGAGHTSRYPQQQQVTEEDARAHDLATTGSLAARASSRASERARDKEMAEDDARAHYSATTGSLPCVLKPSQAGAKSTRGPSSPLSRSPSDQSPFYASTVPPHSPPEGGRYIYAVGGPLGQIFEEGDPKYRGYLAASKSAWLYDGVLGKWRQVAAMSHARSMPAACTLDGRCVVAGGFDNEHETSCAVEAHSVHSDEWRSLARLVRARDSFSLVVVDGQVLAVGGWDHKNRLVGDVERYDAAEDRWNIDSCGAMTAARGALAVAAHNGLVYAAGGFDADNKVLNLLVYEALSY